MKPVVIESPYMGNAEHSREEHIAYLQECIRYSVKRGETPYASHQMLTHAFDDDDPDERALGMRAGFAMNAIFQTAIVYCDYGISRGMLAGIETHRKAGRKVIYRCIL